jgi:branched-chain amino acid aminotransferase
MDRLVSLDSDPVPAADARISAVSSAAFYAKGVFTTIRIFEGQPFLFEKHRERLRRDAGRIGINISHVSDEGLRKALFEILEKNGRTDGRARITIFDEAPGGPWYSGEKSMASILITTADRHPIDPLKVSVSPYIANSRSPLVGVKSCNYLESLMALDEAKERGFDDAIRLNERGEVVSTCMASVFWLNGGQLYTSSLKTGCLAGTTREFVLENLECEETEAGIGDLRESDEVFLTSAGIGVVQVAEFEGRKLLRGGHPIMNVLPF